MNWDHREIVALSALAFTLGFLAGVELRVGVGVALGVSASVLALITWAKLHQ